MYRGRGFTLIEVLIVLAIAGILTAVAIPIYNNYMVSSRESVARTNLETLRLAEEAYFFDNNTYRPGTYDAATATDSLNSVLPAFPPLGWKPNQDDNETFKYVVAAGACGTIASCFQITVTGFDGKVDITE